MQIANHYTVKHILPFLLILLTMLTVTLPTRAENNMNLMGELIAPPSCSISNNEDIVVLFGNVGVTKVDGVNYLQDINYHIDCEAQGSTLELTLTMQGAPTGFDPAALQTNVPDLGIKLLQNGKAMTLNEALVINPANPPRLQAVPVKMPGSKLTEQPFEVSATLQASYQ